MGCIKVAAGTDYIEAQANRAERSDIMPVEIKLRNTTKTYYTVAERVTMIHGDFPNAVGIETEIVSHHQGIDYDLLANRIETTGTPRKQVHEILNGIKRGEVVVRAIVTVHTENGERKFSGIAHERENIRDKRTVNATSFVENAETSAIGRALAASGRSGSEFCSADELAAALEEAESDLLTTVREQRERRRSADETESVLKSQINTLRDEVSALKAKIKQNPALVAANQQFSTLAKVGDQEQRRTKLMEVCRSLVGDALDSILDLITSNRDQLTGDEAMRLLLACYLCR